MYENETYEAILERMLERALGARPGTDRREGSLLWLAHAPAAAELVNVYIALDAILKETFADTASRRYLILRAAERGIEPRAATCAKLELLVSPDTLSLPEGTRFSLGSKNYAVSGDLGGGRFEMTCETAGEAGNVVSGDVIPIEYIQGLESCAVSGVLIPGEDEEDTESLRRRYIDSLKRRAFGGNRADYIEKIGSMAGVGGVKVYRAWNAGLDVSSLRPPADAAGWIEEQSAPADVASWLSAVYEAAEGGLLTVGGTVRAVIIDSGFEKPSDALVLAVQQAVDPREYPGEGLGLAPMGHVVTVEGVGEAALSVGVSVQLSDGYLWDDVSGYAADAVRAYFSELASGWADAGAPITVRLSQIETRLLSIGGIVDVTGAFINGATENLTLGADVIPVLLELSRI